jgi:hypothetical protein
MVGWWDGCFVVGLLVIGWLVDWLAEWLLCCWLVGCWLVGWCVTDGQLATQEHISGTQASGLS